MSAPLGTWPTIHALRNADRPALIDGTTGRTTTYLELEERTTRLASGLLLRGVEAGDRVAIFSINCPEMLEALIAVAKLGAIGVMINMRLTPAEVEFILKDSGSTHLFASTSLLSTAETAAKDTPINDIITITTAEQRSTGERAGFDDLLDSGSTDVDLAEVDPDSPAILMYTSGTTGTPKGAIITHTNLFWVSIYHNAFEKGLNRFDVSLASAPLFHIGALALYTIPGLYWGAATVVQESFDPIRWAELAEKYGVTKAFAVPTMWRAILNAGGLENHDVSTLDVAITGGAPCPLPVIEALQAKGVRFTEGFGMTETTAMASTLPSTDVTEQLGSIGRPALHVDFRIVDALDNDVPVGEIGELLIRGPSVSPGYWNRPEATRESFHDGWFHSGDLATVDEKGFYRIVDRKKDMLISGGENVYPVEVEQAIFEHPAIAEVAVVGMPDEKFGETVAASIVLRPVAAEDNAAPSHEELITDIQEFVGQRLAWFKVPRLIEFVEELPRTATGKVRKAILRTTFGKSHDQATAQPTN